MLVQTLAQTVQRSDVVGMGSLTNGMHGPLRCTHIHCPDTKLCRPVITRPLTDPDPFNRVVEFLKDFARSTCVGKAQCNNDSKSQSASPHRLST
eukprot:1681498-Amphidinium_carterae.1